MQNTPWRLLIIVAVPLFFWFGYVGSRHTPPLNSTIDVEVSPQASAITIDGTPGRKGNNKVVVGTHKVVVQQAGFKQFSQTVTTEAGQTSYVGAVLSPGSSATANWYSTHTGDQKLAEAISSHSFDYQSQQASQKNPLLQQLPVTYDTGAGEVTISSGVPLQSSDQPAVYVSATTPVDRQSALTWIRTNGYDPSTMDIVFNNISTGVGE